MLLVRLVGNDTWVVPYNNPRVRRQHSHYPPVSKTPPERSKGGDPEALRQIPRRASFGGLEEHETSPNRATGLAARNKFLRLTIRLPCAVKFLEFLEPSPKEGSKRGLGQRPKVFPEKNLQKGLAGIGISWYNRWEDNSPPKRR